MLTAKKSIPFSISSNTVALVEWTVTERFAPAEQTYRLIQTARVDARQRRKNRALLDFRRVQARQRA
jgi:hypothetical protein